MTTFLSRLHAHLRLARLTKRGATHRAEDVPKGVHKTYPRMERISLPAPLSLSISLQDTLKKRSSAFSGNPDIPLTLGELGTLLGSALGKRSGAVNRNYPSGGALYPVETYLISIGIESQTPAAFHYDPTLHALERLWDLPRGFDMKKIAKSPDSLPLSTLIVFTGVWRRSFAKYGDLAYLHTLLEAGHMSENILLVGTALGLNVRPYAGFNDALIHEILDLEEGEEQAVHSVTLCKGGKTRENRGVPDDQL